jgi:hypothetical protein
MKISPALQLIMKAAANAAARRALNLNHFLNLNPQAGGAGIKNKLKIRIKTDSAPASNA